MSQSILSNAEGALADEKQSVEAGVSLGLGAAHGIVADLQKLDSSSKPRNPCHYDIIEGGRYFVTVGRTTQSTSR